MASPKYSFDAPMLKISNIDAAYIEFPFDCQKEFGLKGQVKVKAIFNNTIEYRGSLAKMGHQCHCLGIKKEIRKALNLSFGDIIHIDIVQDIEPRIVEVPEDVQNELIRKQDIFEFFSSLSYTHKKEYVNYINEAKKAETRKRRIEKTMEMLSEVIEKKNKTNK